MPDAAEVESAHTLADQARERLKPEGFDDPTIDRLAESYAGSHGAGDVEDFIDWALAHREVARHPDDPDRTGEQSFPASDPPSTWTGAEPGAG
jgi:hypothetical protein